MGKGNRVYEKLMPARDFLNALEDPEKIHKYIKVKPPADDAPFEEKQAYRELAESLTTVDDQLDSSSLSSEELITGHNKKVVEDAKLKGLDLWKKDAENLKALAEDVVQDDTKLKAYFFDDTEDVLTSFKNNIKVKIPTWENELTGIHAEVQKALANKEAAQKRVDDLALKGKHWTKGLGIAGLVAGATAGLYYLFGKKKPSTEATSKEPKTA
jgi:hypothetical protein